METQVPQPPAPPVQASPSPTQMVAEPERTRMVKIRALKPIRIPGPVVEGRKTRKPVQVGEVVEVTEELAKVFCDHKFKGQYAFSGERTKGVDDVRHVVVRAERVKD